MKIWILAALAMAAVRMAHATAVPTADELFLTGVFPANPGLSGFVSEEHSGEAMDLSVRRPAVDLTGTIWARKYGRAGSRLIGNLYHRGRFYIARVPNQGVAAVDFHISYFPPVVLGRYIAAHSLLRIEMQPGQGVQAIAPMPSSEELTRLAAMDDERALQSLPPEREERLLNVAISAEAQWSQQDQYKSYSLFRGQRGAYVDVVRFMSMEERALDFFESGHPVDQIRLPQTERLDEVLRTALARSQSDGLKKIYNTLFYNCTTLAFDVVEAALGKTDPRLGFIRKYAQRSIPTIAPAKVAVYGGVKIEPMQTDVSLASEFKQAYMRAMLSRDGALCTASMSEGECRNVKQAESIALAAP